jgi:hypothetical protein
MTLRPGTRIETLGTPALAGFPAVAPERLKIVKPRAENLPMPGPESRFRVVGNR